MSVKAKRAKILFVTGTDTGVGKTVLTTLLLAWARGAGKNVLALKPFCSGSREDAEHLWAREKECLTLEEVNPFYFDKPVAPRAAVPAKRLPSLSRVVNYIEAQAGRCDILLIEGAGGLLSPLGANFTLADLILALRGGVIVVGQNKLGTINHVLLTLAHLETVGVKGISVVMMQPGKLDPSAGTNLRILGEMAPEIVFHEVPFLSAKPLGDRQMKKSVTFLQKTLAEILNAAIVSLLARKGGI